MKEKICGIYKIINIVNNKVYIGSSTDTKTREKSHKKELRGGRHFNKYLQRAWDKYGETNFKFQVIEELEVDKILIQHREQFWFDYYNKITACYNVRLVVESTLGLKHSEETKKKISKINSGRIQSEETINKKRKSREGYIMSEETKEKIRQSHLGIKHTKESIEKMRQVKLGKKLSEEHKRKIGEVGIGNKRNLGLKHTEETKEKISKAHKGKIVSAETREKISKIHKGRVVTKETREKMRQINLGRIHSEETKNKMIEAQKERWKRIKNIENENIKIILDKKEA